MKNQLNNLTAEFHLTQQTAKKDLETKWKQQLQQDQRSNKPKAQVILPFYDDKLKESLTKYIEYCCKFSWLIVTQVPPLMIGYQKSAYDPRAHVESSSFSRENRTGSTQIMCYLWPTLLDCDHRVIERGEVVL